jgi:hypothetical protein
VNTNGVHHVDHALAHRDAGWALAVRRFHVDELQPVGLYAKYGDRIAPHARGVQAPGRPLQVVWGRLPAAVGDDQAIGRVLDGAAPRAAGLERAIGLETTVGTAVAGDDLVAVHVVGHPEHGARREVRPGLLRSGEPRAAEVVLKDRPSAAPPLSETI